MKPTCRTTPGRFCELIGKAPNGRRGELGQKLVSNFQPSPAGNQRSIPRETMAKIGLDRSILGAEKRNRK